MTQLFFIRGKRESIREGRQWKNREEDLNKEEPSSCFLMGGLDKPWLRVSRPPVTVTLIYRSLVFVTFRSVSISFYPVLILLFKSLLIIKITHFFLSIIQRFNCALIYNFVCFFFFWNLIYIIIYEMNY